MGVTRKNILDFTNSKDRCRYVFSKDNFDKHKQKHPELKNPEFLNGIPETIDRPNFIFPAYKKKHRFCFYHYEFESYGVKWYSKVIIEETKHLRIIITAHRTSKIKEKKYFNPLNERP